jgi:hypothetical protein
VDLVDEYIVEHIKKACFEKTGENSFKAQLLPYSKVDYVRQLLRCT